MISHLLTFQFAKKNDLLPKDTSMRMFRSTSSFADELQSLWDLSSQDQHADIHM